MSRAAAAPISLSARIERAEVLRLLGYPAGREPPARIARLLEPALDEARALVRARGCYRRLPGRRAEDLGLRPVEAKGLAVGLVTAGGLIEERARARAASGELARAVLLDAAGSAAAEEAADRLGARIAGAAGTGPCAPALCRLSPGYGRWTLAWQPAVFALLPHREIGVSLLPSLLMVPQKSISFAMWLGASGPLGRGRAECARCRLARCRYRRGARPRAHC
ncbi:MAG: hypothetical protein HY744_32320 [Deltaproteobacteria bacterium]|nr:hypothetical protein [Deltaproteobacteria bacterium]